MNHASSRCMYYDETRGTTDIEVTDLETKSILKPPKARAPLQEVDFLGAETDPDIIRKRRVSFAGVKIKEFNSKAESLIICSTPAYEETFSTSSDNSTLTNSGIENSEGVECLIDCAILNDTMDLTDLSNKEDADNNMDFTNLPKAAPPSEGLYKKNAASLPTDELPGRQPIGYNFFGDESVKDVPLTASQLPPSMDPTKLLVNALLENSNIMEDASLIQENILNTVSLVKEVRPVPSLNENHFGNNLSIPKSESGDKSIPTNLLKNSMADQSGMEFTSAIPQNCVFPKVPDSSSNDDFFTDAISSKVAQERLNNVQSVSPNREQGALHGEMEFTEIIPKFSDENCRFPLNVGNRNITHRRHALSSEPGTMSILDASLSMEFTEVLKPRKSCFIEEPNKENVRPFSDNYCEGNSEIESSVMEFTEAVIFPKANNVLSCNNENPIASLMNSFVGSSHETQQKFHTSQMEFTEAIPSKFRSELFLKNKNVFQNSMINESFGMEMTEAISNVKKPLENIVDLHKGASNENINGESKFKTNVHSTRELTSPLAFEANKKILNDENHLVLNTSTMLEQNKHSSQTDNGDFPIPLVNTAHKNEVVDSNSTVMDFTEAIPQYPNVKNDFDNIGFYHKNTKRDAKSVTNAQSAMELTAAFASKENNKPSEYANDICLVPARTMFEQSKPVPKNNDFWLHPAVYTSNDEGVGNNSMPMEFTEAIPQCLNVKNSPDNIILPNKNPEEVVKHMAKIHAAVESSAALAPKENDQPSDYEKRMDLNSPTMSEQNKPESIMDNDFWQQPAVHRISKDESVCNNSTLMEFTEAIPLCLNVKNGSENIKSCVRNTMEDVKSLAKVNSAMELTALVSKENYKQSDDEKRIDLYTPTTLEHTKPETKTDENCFRQLPVAPKDEGVCNDSMLMEFTEVIPKFLNVKITKQNMGLGYENIKNVESIANVHSAIELTSSLPSQKNPPSNTLSQSGFYASTVHKQNVPQIDNACWQQPVVCPISTMEDSGNNSTLMDFTEAVPQIMRPFPSNLTENKFQTKQTEFQTEFTKGNTPCIFKNDLSGQFSKDHPSAIFLESSKSTLNNDKVYEFSAKPADGALKSSELLIKGSDPEIVDQPNEPQGKFANENSKSTTIGFIDMVESFSLPQVEIEDIPRLPPEIDRTQKFELQKCMNVSENPNERDNASEFRGMTFEVDFTDMLPLNRETHMPDLQKKLIFSMPEKGDICDASQTDVLEALPGYKPVPFGCNAAREIEEGLTPKVTQVPRKLPRLSTANVISGGNHKNDFIDETDLEESVKAKTSPPDIISDGRNLAGIPHFSEKQTDLSQHGSLKKNSHTGEPPQSVTSVDNIVCAYPNEKNGANKNFDSKEFPNGDIAHLTEKLVQPKIDDEDAMQQISSIEMSNEKQETKNQLKEPPENMVSRKNNLLHQPQTNNEDFERQKKAFEQEQWENLLKNRAFFNELNFFSMGPYVWKYSMPWPLEIAVRISKEVVTLNSENISKIELRSTLDKRDLIGQMIDHCMKKNLNLILSEDWLNSNCKNIKSLLIAIKIIENEYDSLKLFFSSLKSVSLEAPWTFKENCIHFNLVSLEKRYHVLIKVNISNIKHINGNDVEVVNYMKEIRQSEVQKIFDKCEPSKERFHKFIKAVKEDLEAR